MPAPHHSIFYWLDALPDAQPTASNCQSTEHTQNNTYSAGLNVLITYNLSLVLVTENDSQLNTIPNSVLLQRGHSLRRAALIYKSF